MSYHLSKTRCFNVLVIDRSPLIQQGYKVLLSFKNTRHSFRIVLANNELQAHDLLFANDFDVILFEYRGTAEDSLKGVSKMQETQPGVGILITTTTPLQDLERRLVHHRGVRILSKQASLEELIRAIEEVIADIPVFDKGITRVVNNSLDDSRAANVLRPKVSSRELDVLKLVYLEKTNKEIAADLYISERTVETHRKNLMRKFQVRGIAGLIRVGYALDLLR